MIEPHRQRQDIPRGSFKHLRPGTAVLRRSLHELFHEPCRNSPSQASSLGRFSIRFTTSSAALRARSSISSGAICKPLIILLPVCARDFSVLRFKADEVFRLFSDRIFFSINSVSRRHNNPRARGQGRSIHNV